MYSWLPIGIHHKNMAIGFFSPPQNMANFDLLKNMKNPLNRSKSYFSQVGKSKISPPQKKKSLLHTHLTVEVYD